ncbi:MAG TPA: (5-formylfuran-3-yl)methyl phosphate synthase [Thiobacillaceae bacterium]|nr:(5-formylfuran-3-yl)methyl phosphate synthase [Thiobacillaceae bacterium]HNF87898.1 (5-formylfuran-3-yl)methyl phosphate synthase [Thiobacillaceae bacterium]HNH88821.1 (5-formylfuran-3-yl)methyl phosphate synthase [Thiobacillaceae bacterium]
MSGWLASVTGAEEARLALAAGADLIDCKNPAAGALGALPRATVAEVLAAVGGRRPVSATIGDFPDMAVEAVVAAAEAMAATGVDYVKIGLFPAPGLPDCLEALAALARRQPLVAVLFADRSPDFGLLPRLARNGFAGVMLDTAGKTGAGLLDHQPLAALAAFLAAARRQGLLGGLAGSLGLADIARLRPLGADYLGFRGALCAGGRRQAGLDQAALARVARALAVPMAEPA